MHLAVNFLSARSLIEAFGTAGVCAVIFAETGLLIGFFLPGDSLLFTAGFFASKTIGGVHLSLAGLVPGVVAGALIGAEVGYLIGRHGGPRLFARPESRFFKQDYVDRAEEYFTRFGPGKAVVLARFVPIVRTFLNPLCGVLRMPMRDFTLWNIVGGVPWAAGLTLLGYGVGSSIHGNIDKYILPLVAIIIVLSLLPIAFEGLRQRRRSRLQPPNDKAASSTE